MVEERRQKKDFVERRRGPDWVTRTIQWFSGISWLLSISIALSITHARPQREDFFSRILNVQLDHSWNRTALYVALSILIVNVIICIFGIVFNFTRNKRKTDKIRKSLFILLGLSILGLIYVSYLLQA